MDETTYRTPMVDAYAAVGGLATCQALAVAFYAGVARDPILRPLFPGKTFTCAIAEFTAFLVQFLGGPPEATQRRHWVSLRESHRRFPIGPRERDAWLVQMDAALAAVPLEPPVRQTMRAFFACAATSLVPAGPPALPAVCSDLDQDELGRTLVWRWGVYTALDTVTSDIFAGRAAHAVASICRPPLAGYLERDHALWASVLGRMLGSGDALVHDYVRATLRAQPDLVHARFGGHTLLHTACAMGQVDEVRLLLQLGADSNALDAGSHGPLYWLANARESTGSAQVVEALVAAGAEIHAAAGTMRCTALHMAARRGNVRVMAALLAHGASLQARDRRGDTPLQRAIKCRQRAAAAWLLAQDDRGSP
jgi:hemoglobin